MSTYKRGKHPNILKALAAKRGKKPKIAEEKKRNKLVQIFLTQEEVDQVKQDVKNTGKSRSRLFREAYFNKN